MTNALLGLADGLEVYDLDALVRAPIETSVIGDLHLRVVEADVPRHEGSFGVVEADLCSILERVVDELGTVRILDLDALRSSDDGIVPEYGILGPSGITNLRLVGPSVREGVEPEEGRCSQLKVIRPRNYSSTAYTPYGVIALPIYDSLSTRTGVKHKATAEISAISRRLNTTNTAVQQWCNSRRFVKRC